MEAFMTLKNNKKAFKLISLMSTISINKEEGYSPLSYPLGSKQSTRQNLSIPRVKMDKIILDSGSVKEINKNSMKIEEDKYSGMYQRRGNFWI